MCAWWDTVLDAGIEAIPLVGKVYNIVKGTAAKFAGDHEEAEKNWAEFGFLGLLPWSSGSSCDAETVTACCECFCQLLLLAAVLSDS